MQPANRYVIDTNVAIAILNGEPAACHRLHSHPDCVLPVIVVGELLLGARRSARWRDNEARVWDLVSGLLLALCDTEVARQYAEIQAELLATGRPIPQNDIWIAAVCRAAGLPLASRDAHFDAIDGLARDGFA